MRPGWTFWAIGLLAILWNGFGMFDLVMTVGGNEDYLSSYSPEQIAYWQSMPAWRYIVWVAGVGTAFLASVLLLLRRAEAAPLFAVGPVCLVLGLVDDLASGGLAIYGVGGFAFSGVIIAVGVFLTLYAYRQKARGVLRGGGQRPLPA